VKPVVGDDVVDLDDPALGLTHPRFAERVCDEDERGRLAADPRPSALLWALFAAKEAAFKAVSKRGAVPVFAHRRFSVSADLTAVRYGSLALPLRVERGDGFVHAVAGARATIAVVRRIPPGADPSEAVRALVARVVGARLGVPASEIAIERTPRHDAYDGLGPPRLVVRGEPSPLDLSMSHDGRFVSFAVCGGAASPGRTLASASWLERT
jgi:hypothetical protein